MGRGRLKLLGVGREGVGVSVWRVAKGVGWGRQQER